MRLALAAAGTDVAGFRKLPKEEQNAFLAMAAGEQRPEAIAAAVAGREGWRLIERRNIARSPTNRNDFDEEKMKELVESIREHGIAQPLMVRPLHYAVIENGANKLQVVCQVGGGAEGGGTTRYAGPQFDDTVAGKEAADRELAKWQGTMPSFEIVMGERRWRASEKAKLDLLPCIVRQLTDREALELQLTENLQREDLRPMDEARGYRAMLELGYSVEEISKKLKRSKSSIYNALNLLELPAEARKAVEQGTLPPSHANLLVTIDDPKARERLATAILKPVRVWTNGKEAIETIGFRDAKALADTAKADLEREQRWEKETESYRADPLCKVFTIKQSKGCFNWSQPKSGYVRPDEPCDLDQQGRSWKSLLTGEHAQLRIIAYCEASSNHLRVLYARKAAEKALREAGIDLGKGAGNVESKEEARKREAEEQRLLEERRLAVDCANIGSLVAAAEAREFNSDVLRLIARGLQEQITKEMMVRRGRPREVDYQAQQKAEETLLNKADAKTLRGILLEMVLWQWESADPELVKEAARIFKVKLQTIGKGK